MPSQENSTPSQQQIQPNNTSGGQQSGQDQQVTVVERGSGISVVWPSGQPADR